MGIELTAVFFGLAAAVTWGAGDFSGGMATKRSHVYLVVLLSHVVGLAGLFLLILLFGEPFPTWPDLFVGGLAGRQWAGSRPLPPPMPKIIPPKITPLLNGLSRMVISSPPTVFISKRLMISSDMAPTTTAEPIIKYMCAS